jgi:pimeloyl-ACP methyl ester carboxylesterase
MALPTEHYHWLSEGLKNSMRVVLYDRAGIGYSDASDTSRDPETVARELHTLLERGGESPPYILAGHSFGGAYLRVFAQLYPEEVEAMVFIDCTHPDRVERLDLPKASSFKFKAYMWTLYAQAALCDLGILGIYDRLYGPILSGEGLPDEINTRMLDFSLDGKYAHGFTKEMKDYHSGLKRSGEAKDFGSMPIRVFAAIEMDKEVYRAMGIDPVKRQADELKMYQGFADLSTNGKLLLMEANHNTIYTKKENADIICKEIISLLKELEGR